MKYMAHGTDQETMSTPQYLGLIEIAWPTAAYSLGLRQRVVLEGSWIERKCKRPHGQKRRHGSFSQDLLDLLARMLGQALHVYLGSYSHSVSFSTFNSRAHAAFERYSEEPDTLTEVMKGLLTSKVGAKLNLPLDAID